MGEIKIYMSYTLYIISQAIIRTLHREATKGLRVEG